jgi:hypothetical protein
MHNRTDERAELRRILVSGASVQMFAPRRIGKTWLMLKLADDLRKEGWTTIVVDVEGMRTENEFLRALCRKLEEAGDPKSRALQHLTHRLKQLITDGWQGSPLNAIGRIDFAKFSEALIGALDQEGGDTVILIDEIALFVAERLAQDHEGTRAFLYHLRRLRQSYPKVRWLFTGSIGLDVVARREGLQGSLVDLKPFPLDPFGDAAARSYLEHLSAIGSVPRQFALDDVSFAHLARELGWLAPFYLQLIADRISPSGPLTNGRPLAQTGDVDRAFAELLKPEFRTLFAPFEEHIDKNFPQPEARCLHQVLGACCETVAGESVASLLVHVHGGEPSVTLRQLMDWLTALANAGFLVEQADRWRFRSGLLRRYWHRYMRE